MKQQERDSFSEAVVKVFKPYVVRRAQELGGCQVLFPLNHLDKLVCLAIASGCEGMLRERKRRRAHCRVNLNDLARRIALAEGQKKQISIGQVRDVMRLLFLELAGMTEDELEGILVRHGWGAPAKGPAQV